MAKRKNKKAQIAKKDKAAQKKFFTITMIITLLLIAFLYMASK